MFNDYKVFFDYDGVLVNSERLIVQKQKESNLSWKDFFEQLNWEELYESSSEINNAFEILRKLQEERNNLYVLTKIHSLIEANVKINLLREEKILIPVFVVPPHTKKSEIYIPDPKSLLIDDSKKNIDDWNNHGGRGLLFDEMAEGTDKSKVKSLHFLLK